MLNKIPFKEKIFAVKKGELKKCKLPNDWKMWYQCEAKNAARLYRREYRVPHVVHLSRLKLKYYNRAVSYILLRKVKYYKSYQW